MQASTLWSVATTLVGFGGLVTFCYKAWVRIYDPRERLKHLVLKWVLRVTGSVLACVCLLVLLLLVPYFFGEKTTPVAPIRDAAATILFELELKEARNLDTLAYSSDGKFVGVATSYGAVRVWDTTTQAEAFSLPDRFPHYFTTAFSADLQRLAIGESDDKSAETIKLWNVITDDVTLKLDGAQKGSLHMAFSPNRSRLACYEYLKDRISIWDAEKGRFLAEFPADDIHLLAFSPDGQRILTANRFYNKPIKVREAPDGTQVFTLNGHYSGVSEVVWSPNGKLIASCGAHEVKVWDAETGGEIQTLRAESPHISYSFDSKMLAIGDRSEGVVIFDATAQKRLLSIDVGKDVKIDRVAFSPTGKCLAIANAKKSKYSVTIWSLESLE